jgi:hypothetical protein
VSAPLETPEAMAERLCVGMRPETAKWRAEDIAYGARARDEQIAAALDAARAKCMRGNALDAIAFADEVETIAAALRGAR